MVSLDFIAGYWTGEGWFYIQTVNKMGHKSFVAGITVHEKELPVLQDIRDTLQCGYIRRPRKQKQYVDYYINRYKELLIFKENIGPLLLGRKKEQFLKWWRELNGYKTDKNKRKLGYSRSKGMYSRGSLALKKIDNNEYLFIINRVLKVGKFR